MKWDGEVRKADVRTALKALCILPVRQMLSGNYSAKEIAEYMHSVFKEGYSFAREKELDFEYYVWNSHFIVYFRNQVINKQDKYDSSISLTWNQCAKELMKMNEIDPERAEKVKWDQTSDLDVISQALMRFITAEERQKALKMSYGDLTGIIRKAHMHGELVLDDFEIHGYFDKVTVYIKSKSKMYEMTWNKAAKAINRYVHGEEQESKTMAGIDFKALKNARKAIEDRVEDNVPEELESSYTSVWGGQKENVIQIEVTRIMPFTDENGRSQPYKLNQNRVEQIAASAKDIGIVTPLTVRKKGDTYEMISGHHRLAAAKSIGQLKVPCIVKEYSDEELFKVLAESNIQRDKILPSEYGKIFAKYMELRDDEETTSQEIADKFGVSRKTMYRYLDINKMTSGLQELFDSGIINVGAVEYIKGFSETVQNALYEALTEKGIRLSLVLAKRIREYVSDCDELTAEDIIEILTVREEPKRKYANNVYNNICGKYNVTMSESELDKLAEKLLGEYFANR